MLTRTRISTSLITAMSALLACTAAAASGERDATGYDVTITNLTRAQSFTPALIVSHRTRDHLLFNAGDPASTELAALAEGGDTQPLEQQLSGNPGVSSIANSGVLLAPGGSVTVHISALPRDHVSMAAMLIPTNDGFFSFQDLDLPRARDTVTAYSPAYDAGSEPNDELCINIPGPVCGGAGGSPEAGGEGYVHIHSGIHGIGNLEPATYDWRNPVARVTITRSR